MSVKESEQFLDTTPYDPPALQRPQTAVIEVPIDSVLASDSPRSAGSSSTHARLLAETDADLPPIVVHRQSMRVIDGMHRLEAARLRAARTIRVVFFDGDDEEAFVLAVETNIRHGLPLSLADRKAAALRIVKAHPHWSDRAVAAKAGLTHKTVGLLRRRSTGEIPQLEARVGLDGRLRAVRPARKAERCTDGPDEEQATTVEGRSRNSPAVSACHTAACPVTEPTAAPAGPTRRHTGALLDAGVDWNVRLQRLRADPSLRYTQIGRMVLRIMDLHVATAAYWPQVAEQVPVHCLDTVSDFALRCAEDLQRLSLRLEQRRDENR
ncbi:ParB N-terminal domain-containing protein [Streptomyces sp. NPDC006274]|uniref:ParB/RepB/Spo0J family partition protein n=1 Tax=unclassified Streptomyces TaxID=2593676 RepID=UPI00339FD1BA